MASTSDDNAATEYLPILSKKFNITDIKQDALKWDKEWEAAIASSSATDVLTEICNFLDDSRLTPDVLEFLHSDLRKVQESVAGILRTVFDKGQNFHTVWLLLDSSEQRRHILEGLKKPFESRQSRTLWGQDCRALCPEITVSNFLSQGGKGFLDFLTRTLEVLESSETPAFLPNQWWEQASNLPNPWWNEASNEKPTTEQKSRSTKLVFEVATIDRNKFIGYFAMCSVTSIYHDLAHRSEGMKDVLDIVENSDGAFSRSLANTKTTLRDKPLVRCENCTKTPEEIEPGVRFMVCSTCKSKLKFEVHYCSRTCQQKDWPVHKSACGKKKVSKGLSGTKGDSLWAFTDPITEMIRNSRGKDGHINLRDMGMGPAKGKRSPAAERQAAMLQADRDVDYFLFTASGEPVRLVINDQAVKMTFRVVRSMVIMQTDHDTGIGAMTEYILELMSGYPGLSRRIILEQLCAEYGDDTAQKVAEWKQIQTQGPPGSTWVESWSKNLSNSMIGQISRMTKDIPKLKW